MNSNGPSESRAPDEARRAAGDPASPQACDLLIRNGYVITLDGRRRTFRSGAVAVETTGTVIGGTYKPPFCC